MEKKNNKGLICLVVILVIACLGLTGYILVDKGVIKLKKEEPKIENKKVVKETELDPDSYEVIELLNKVFAVDNYKNFGVYDNYLFNSGALKNGFDVTTMSTSLAEALTSNYINNIVKGGITNLNELNLVDNTGSNVPQYSLKKETFEKYFHEFFGPSIDLDKLSDENGIKRSCMYYHYSQEYGGYIKQTECGGTTGSSYLNKVKKVIKDDKKIVITFMMFKFYSNKDIMSNDTLITTVDFNANYEEMEQKVEELRKDIYDKYEDKAEKYEIVFKKDRDDYYLNKVAKIA